MLWKTIMQELGTSVATRSLSDLKITDYARPLQLAFVSLAAGGILSFAFSSLNLQFTLPIRQLHVAWNLTRILIEF